MIKKILVTVLVVLFSFTLFGIDENDAQAGAFLRIPVGARPAGLGDTFVAVSDDANAVYWNPGGLYQVQAKTFGGMYNLLSMDRHHYEGSFIYPNNSSTFAFMFNSFGVSDIDGRDENGNPTGKFDDTETSITIGYCYKLPSAIGLGANLKYLIHSLDENKATGIGFDFGVHKKILKLRLGASVSNIAAKLNWDTDSSLEEEIPTTIRAGGAYEMSLGMLPMLASVEISKTAGEKVSIHLGTEISIFNSLMIRGGYYESNINFGVSIKVAKIRVDYAMVQDFLDEGATNKIGIQIEF